MPKRADRARVRLGSGLGLDLIDLQPDAWSDEDLATELARTYRWGGNSTWALPFSVARHSLTVLAIRQGQEGRNLAAAVALRELLHDADEGLLGFDCITPLKQHLGELYRRLTRLLQATIAERHHLPAWDQEDYLLHKQAERLAAISEAAHVVGWSMPDILEEFATVDILIVDPLQNRSSSMTPWKPWPLDLAAWNFLRELCVLNQAVARDRTLAELAAAYVKAPASIQRRCTAPVHGSATLDYLVQAEASNGEAWEGVIVAGEIVHDGAWALDTKFVIITTDERPEGQLITVFGWEYDIQLL